MLAEGQREKGQVLWAAHRVSERAGVRHQAERKGTGAVGRRASERAGIRHPAEKRTVGAISKNCDWNLAICPHLVHPHRHLVRPHPHLTRPHPHLWPTLVLI